MKIMAQGATDVGRKRSQNEDYFLLNHDINLYILADGMGGHSGGEFASRMAVQTIEEVMKGLISDPEATVISGVNSDEAQMGDQIRYAIQTASKKIFDRATYDPALKGMGTTAVLTLFDEGKAYIANVGDSRAYFFSGPKMRQVTTDHSLVNEQIRAGLISKSDAKNHKLKNIITRSVGYQEEVEIDLKPIDVKIGDKILLCSDGLSNMLHDEAIEKIVQKHSCKEACQKLIEAANEAGGEDNITVILMVVTDPAG